MSNRVYAYLSSKKGGYGERKFPVVFDCPLNDEASETLDSATIVIPNLYERIDDIEPYQEVALAIETDTPYKVVASTISTATPLTYAVRGTEITLRSELPSGAKIYAQGTDSKQSKTFYVLAKTTGGNKAVSMGRIFYEVPSVVTNYRRFLIDSFNEAQTNVEKPIYTYTIELMSETKYLEKIQCPNLCITHKGSGAKSILEYIELYMDLYCPKIKTLNGMKWEYKPLITISSNVRNKFADVPCADMSMSQPTLRQVLTSLMIQKGCIPVVKDRRLSYMDFRRGIPQYEGEEGRMTIERAMSSDSYVNTLVNMGDNVYDTEDTIVSETLAFRDRNNVLLKQQENLRLETRYPIYNVRNFTLNAYSESMLYINKNGKYKYRYFFDDKTSYFGLLLVSEDSTEKLRITNAFFASSTLTHTFVGYFTIDCYVCHWDKDNSFVIDKTIAKRTESLTISGTYETPYNSEIELFKNSDYNYRGSFSIDNTFCIVRATFHGTADGSPFEKEFFLSDAYDGFAYKTPALFTLLSFATSADYQVSTTFSPGDGTGGAGGGGWQLYTLYKKDITSLLVESSKRNQLDTDFLAMPSKFTTIDDMAKWLYCTIGYEIGNNTISGFSDTYSYTNGWWDTTKTYIENIYTALVATDSMSEAVNTQTIHDTFGGIFDGFTVEKGGDIYSVSTTAVNPFFDDKHNNFSSMFFDISYVPLNSVAMRHFKETADLPIEQLNTTGSGISSAVLLSLNQQDTINRLGNDVLAIHERVPTMLDIQPCPSQYGDYTIFKRECKIGKNAIDVNYYASKNHIMKNYFTAIQTKYRAYEYVDYNQSVLRRESDTVHVLISHDGYIYGDDKLSASDGFTLSLIDGILLLPYGKKLNYSYSGSDEAWYKNECSIYTTDSSVYFNYTQFDNGSEGIFIDGTYLTKDGKYKKDPIGGIPQQWYSPDTHWDDTIEIGFIDTIGMLIPKIVYPKDSDGFNAYIRTLQAQPKFTFPTDIGNRLYISRKVGKDLSERISYTLQLAFYNDDGSVEFSRWLFLASTAVGGRKLSVYGVFDSDDFNAIGYKDMPSGASKDIYLTINAYNVEKNMPRFGFCYQGDISSHTSLKFLCKGDDGLFHDMVRFTDLKKLSEGYQVSYNDTKGTKVYTDSSAGVLTPSYKVVYDKEAPDYDRIVAED